MENLRREEIRNRKRHLIIKGDHYKEIDVNTTIKLLLRCVKLYQAYTDIKRILLMVKREQELFPGNLGPGEMGSIDKIIHNLQNDKED